MENEQADAGRDVRTLSCQTKSQARTGTVKFYFLFSRSAAHEQDWQSCPVDPYSATRDDHTYILVHLFYSRDKMIRPKRFDISSPLSGWMLYYIDYYVDYYIDININRRFRYVFFFLS